MSMNVIAKPLSPTSSSSSSNNPKHVFSAALNYQLSSFASSSSILSLRLNTTTLHGGRLSQPKAANFGVVASSSMVEPMNIMISGATASGKRTHCELIKKKYGLVHIAAGDLLWVEIASGSVNGKRAKEYMEKGQLLPDEIVVVTCRWLRTAFRSQILKKRVGDGSLGACHRQLVLRHMVLSLIFSFS